MVFEIYSTFVDYVVFGRPIDECSQLSLYIIHV